jgi:hypothetical protein
LSAHERPVDEGFFDVVDKPIKERMLKACYPDLVRA